MFSLKNVFFLFLCKLALPAQAMQNTQLLSLLFHLRYSDLIVCSEQGLLFFCLLTVLMSSVSVHFIILGFLFFPCEGNVYCFRYSALIFFKPLLT